LNKIYLPVIKAYALWLSMGSVTATKGAAIHSQFSPQGTQWRQGWLQHLLSPQC